MALAVNRWSPTLRSSNLQVMAQGQGQNLSQALTLALTVAPAVIFLEHTA